MLLLVAILVLFLGLRRYCRVHGLHRLRTAKGLSIEIVLLRSFHCVRLWNI